MAEPLTRAASKSVDSSLNTSVSMQIGRGKSDANSGKVLLFCWPDMEMVAQEVVAMQDPAAQVCWPD